MAARCEDELGAFRPWREKRARGGGEVREKQRSGACSSYPCADDRGGGGPPGGDAQEHSRGGLTSRCRSWRSREVRDDGKLQKPPCGSLFSPSSVSFKNQQHFVNFIEAFEHFIKI